MSDNKDKEATKSSPEFDFDSTVQLDLSKYGNATSTTDDEVSFNTDFDETINGLMEMDDLLEDESLNTNASTDQAQELSSDAIDFDELNAGLDALSEEVMPSAAESDESLFGNEFLVENEESASDEPTEGFDQTVSLDSQTSDNEFLISTGEYESNEFPLLDSADDTPETEAKVEEIDDFSLSTDEIETEDTESSDADTPPVIELTEEMLDEPDQQHLPELDDEAPVSDETDMDDAGTPELTTTETNIVSAATAAMREISGEEENQAYQEPFQPEYAAASPAEPTTTKGGGSSLLATLFGLMGIAVGGFGAWMAFDATDKITSLERQVQALSSSSGGTQGHNMADVQQRLSKIERRLTGTPTIEAAAPLGNSIPETTETVVEEAAEPVATTMPVITPNTVVNKPAATSGGWVVNLSSHGKADIASIEQDRLKKLGLNAEVHSAVIKGKTWYRIQVVGFASKDEAKAELKSVEQRSGIKGAWIGKR